MPAPGRARPIRRRGSRSAPPSRPRSTTGSRRRTTRDRRPGPSRDVGDARIHLDVVGAGTRSAGAGSRGTPRCTASCAGRPCRRTACRPGWRCGRRPASMALTAIGGVLAAVVEAAPLVLHHVRLAVLAERLRRRSPRTSGTCGAAPGGRATTTGATAAKVSRRDARPVRRAAVGSAPRSRPGAARTGRSSPRRDVVGVGPLQGLRQQPEAEHAHDEHRARPASVGGRAPGDPPAHEHHGEHGCDQQEEPQGELARATAATGTATVARRARRLLQEAVEVAPRRRQRQAAGRRAAGRPARSPCRRRRAPGPPSRCGSRYGLRPSAEPDQQPLAVVPGEPRHSTREAETPTREDEVRPEEQRARANPPRHAQRAANVVDRGACRRPSAAQRRARRRRPRQAR